MLDELSVENLGVIRRARLDLGPGLVVVTGETGAGKTLLLGALRLLLGETARKDRVGPAGDTLVVEARMVIEGEERVLARRVTTAGRSKAYLDGSMVTAGALAELAGGAAEIVGQHDHLALATSAGVRRIIDGALPDGGAVAAYHTAWEALVALRREAELLGGDHRALERELEMVRFQVDEITDAGFVAGDDTTLTAEAERLRHHESIVEGLTVAAAALGEEAGAAVGLGQAVAALRRVSRIDSGLEPLAAQAADLAALAGELESAVVSAGSGDDHDPAHLAQVEDRLAVLGDLRRKYGATLDDVLAFGAEATARAAELTRVIDRSDRLDGDIDRASAAVVEAGREVSEQRKAAAERLSREAAGHLQELGFSRPVVHFVFEETAPGPTGSDRITLEFASDESLTPGPVHRVASGGELSRLVLALRIAAGVADVPVVAFDEIDAGIGGATALAMGRKLEMLAAGRQVLCVTHLPQVAAFADTHVVVDRDGGSAEVRIVTGEERLEEVSRMLAGTPGSERGKEHAAEILANAGTTL